MSEAERWAKWLVTPFACGHPNTRENTGEQTNRRTKAGGVLDVRVERRCRVCNRERLRAIAAGRVVKDSLRSNKDVVRTEAQVKSLTALGRCPVCHLLLPCGSTHRASELAENRRAMTMPEGGW